MKVTELLAGQASAERLITLAAKSLNTFFVSPADYKAGSTSKFVGFLRDTLPVIDALEVSTGGLGAVASLYELDRYLTFLETLTCKTALEPLKAKRDLAAAHAADLSLDLSVPASFGFMNAHSASLFSVAMSTKQTPRTAFFAAAAFHAYANGWPTVKEVELPHPFVAHSVLRAVDAFDQDTVAQLAALADLEPPKILASAKLKTKSPRDDRDAGRWFDSVYPDALCVLRKATTPDRDGWAADYGTRAKEYLLQQLAHLHGASHGEERSQAYDPAGACFALAVLVRTALGPRSNQRASVSQFVGEHGDLVMRTVHHVIDSMSSSGTLPFGVPFAYHEKGMGGFATSIAAISALAATLLTLFETSRKAHYPNAEYLQGFVEGLDNQLRRLFRLTSTFEGNVRRVVNPGGDLEDRTMTGWSTDRAPHGNRIESWVTIEVLLFAVFARLLAQEVAQFLVLRKYRGGPSDEEALWPYKRGGFEIDGNAKPAMFDPDLTLNPDEQQRYVPIAPVPFLHRHFQEFMDDASQEWRNKISSVLMLGPPGTSKSTIVKSLARRLNWPLVELTPSQFVLNGLERIEEQATQIFEDLGMLREAVVLFDELDSLLVDRERVEDGSILSFSVPAMLPKVQRLAKLAKRQRLLLVFATNFYDRLDPAMVRRGRIDEHLLVLPYNVASRQKVIGENATGLSEDQVKAAASETVLSVYEDLVRHAEALLPTEPLEASPSIRATLYTSRVEKGSARAMLRLAFEVAEVATRLLEEPRRLDAWATAGATKERLQALEKALKKKGETEWAALCRSIEKVL